MQYHHIVIFLNYIDGHARRFSTSRLFARFSMPFTHFYRDIDATALIFYADALIISSFHHLSRSLRRDASKAALADVIRTALLRSVITIFASISSSRYLQRLRMLYCLRWRFISRPRHYLAPHDSRQMLHTALYIHISIYSLSAIAEPILARWDFSALAFASFRRLLGIWL